MDYISTRGKPIDQPIGGGQPIGFENALLTGLARDGGLFLPSVWPTLSHDEWNDLKDKSYIDVATAIMSRFTDGEIDQGELRAMIADTYADFRDPEIAPLKPLGDNIHLCELFHGPTIAFKDYAMQFLSRAFDRALKARGKRATILGATSGDTGSAAIEAFKGRDFVDVFILFPHGRVSPIQQRQMTSVNDKGVHAVAVKGDFDDCQDAVKALFRDLDFRDTVGLSAINSINWARLMPQIVYYATAALKLGAPQQEVAFAVPTGNFGNIFAGYAAKQMGLPIKRLICASNQNDILARFFEDGRMERRGVKPSLSPSMDIQVSSNFERLLFELLGRDSTAVRAIMDEFSKTGGFSVSPSVLAEAKKLFAACRLDDQGTLAEIAHIKKQWGMTIDPHTAVGTYAARKMRESSEIDPQIPIVALACAHPAKFPDAVEQATGARPALPHHLADLMSRPEVCLNAEAKPSAIADIIMKHKRT